MQVLILSAEFPPGPGGIGTHAHQLALQLLERGWRVSVMTVQEIADEPSIGAFNRSVPFVLERLRQIGPGPIKLAVRFAAVSRRILRDRPDLIIASGERMVWLAALLERTHRVPYVAIGHAMEFNVPSRWQQAATKYAFEHAAGVVCVSQFTWNQMRRRGIQPRAGRVIPNGADATRFAPTTREAAESFRTAYGLSGATLLLTVGSVHERKGQDVVIRALPRIAAALPDVQYVSIGPPYRKDAFSALARTLGVADRAHFLGIVEHAELLRALTAADLFLMTSQHTPDGDFEGYGIAVVEAALCGLPALVSDGSGVIEAIEPGETGLVATESDPASTAERAIELLSDRNRLAAMGGLARSRALESKTWAARGEAYDVTLRSIVAELNASRVVTH